MRVLGIPVKVDVSFFVTALVLGLIQLKGPAPLALWVGVVLAAVLVHELGHAVVGRMFGLSPSILLYGLGGVTSWTEARRLPPPRSIAVSLAGPIAGFLLAALWLAAEYAVPAMAGPSFAGLKHDLLWVTVGWGVLNMLPVLPLDGGNVVRSAVEWIAGRPIDRLAYAFSIVVAAGLAALAILAREFFGAFLALYFGWSNVSALRERAREGDDARLSESLGTAWAKIEAGQGGECLAELEEVLGTARARATRQRATEALAYARLQAGDVAAAQRTVGAYQAQFGQHPYLDATVRLAAGDAAGAAALLEPIYEQSPSARLGRELCRAYARAGDDAKAVALCEGSRASRYAAGLYAVLADEAFHGGRFETAARAAAASHERAPNPIMAFNAACAHARAGNRAAAFEWLGRAVEHGFDDVDLLAGDEDLESLRGTAAFDELLARARQNVRRGDA
jgi:Zn-dependent protease